MKKGFSSFEDAFKDLKPKQQEQPKPTETPNIAEVLKEAMEPDRIEQEVAPVETPIESSETLAKSELTPEDQEFFNLAVRIFGFKYGDRSYHKLRSLVIASHKKDVSSFLAFHLRDPQWHMEMRRNSDISLLKKYQEAYARLLKQTYEAGAKDWLRATTPHEMQFGTLTREARIAKARELAEKAGKDFNALVEDVGIDL